MLYHNILLVKAFVFLFIFSNVHFIANGEEFGVLSPEDTAKIVLLLVRPEGGIIIGDDNYMKSHPLRSSQNYSIAEEYAIKHGNPDGVKYLADALTLHMKHRKDDSSEYIWYPDMFLEVIHYMGLLVRTSEVEKYGYIFANPSDELSLQASAKYYSRLVDREIKVSDKFSNDILRFVPPDNANIDYAELYENVLMVMIDSLSFENFEESKRVFDELNLELFLSKTDKAKIDFLSDKEKMTKIIWNNKRNSSTRTKDGVDMYAQHVAMSNSEGRMYSSKIIEPPESIKEILDNTSDFEDIIPLPANNKQTANNNDNKVDITADEKSEVISSDDLLSNYTFREMNVTDKEAYALFAKEGIDSFVKISNMIIKEEYAQAADYLMDNGIQLDQRKLQLAKGNDPSYIEAMQMIKRLFDDFPPNDISKMSNIRLVTNSETSIPSGLINGNDVNNDELKIRDILILTFEYPNTKDIYKKHFPIVGGGQSAYETITKNGDMRIYMNRINGIWYWNPFGW